MRTNAPILDLCRYAGHQFQFDGTSSYSQDFDPKAGEPRDPFQPKGKLLGSGKFDGRTNYSVSENDMELSAALGAVQN